MLPIHARTRPTVRVALWLLVCLALVAPRTAAHLSIIRQGPESGGAREALDRFGEVLCTGDFNGDGFDDLATAAIYEDLPGYTGNDHGVVVINWGSPEGLTHVGAQLLYAPIDENGSLFGFSMASADFSNDGFDDLVVGIPFADTNGKSNSGLIAVYRAGVLGFQSAPVLYDQSDIGSAVEANDQWGWALAAGDIDADGYADLVVGSPGENSSSGSVVFLFGGVTGLLTTGSYGFTQGHIGTGSSAGDRFGSSIVIGQFTGLNFPAITNPLDVAVGAPGEDVSLAAGLAVDVGMVVVLGSTNSGPQSGLATAYTPVSLGLPGATNTGRALGSALAAGDFDQDGYDDLAVGRPGSSVYPGEVVELHGSGSTMSYNSTRTSIDFGITPAAGDKFASALATGDFDDDGYKDLLVGSPGHTQFIFQSIGRAYLYRSTNGFGLASWTDFQHSDLNVDFTSFDEVGAAVAFGHFDDTGRANMVAGAPGAEGNAGAVHVMAPWRQPGLLQCRNSVAFDCDGKFVYSQKPFDPVYIASTAKNMTILIACERSQLPPSDPKYVSLNAVYEVPAWVADDIGGSQFHVLEGELVTLRALMDMTMSVSGNDAAYAIADLLTGGNAVFVDYFNVVPAFVNEMNARAAQIGMLDTTFTNPAGVSGSAPESTAYDMALLGRTAIQNPLFESVVNNKSWSIPRTIPTIGGGYYSFNHSVGGGFVAALQSWLPEGIGSKDGGTPAAGITGVFQAREEYYPWGIAYGSSFDTPPQAGWVIPDASKLLTLGLDRCFNGPITAVPVNPPPPEKDLVLTAAGNMVTSTFFPPDPIHKEAHLQIHNLVQDGFDAEVEMQVMRETTVEIPLGSTAVWATKKVSGHDGITIVNESGQFTAIEVTLNTVSAPTLGFSIQPGDSVQIPPESLPGGVTTFQMLVSGDPAGGPAPSLRVFESYSSSYVLGDGAPVPAMGELVFVRDHSADVVPHRLDVTLIGQDTDPGHVVGVALHEGSAQYVFEPCPARVEPYGAGWGGTHGVPILTTDSDPVMGTTMTFRFGSSLQQATSGFWAFGLQANDLVTSFGGTLLVKPLAIVPVNVPAQGFEFPYPVPTDPILCGVSVFHQFLMVDPAASEGLSFSRGLRVRYGN